MWSFAACSAVDLATNQTPLSGLLRHVGRSMGALLYVRTIVQTTGHHTGDVIVLFIHDLVCDCLIHT